MGMFVIFVLIITVMACFTIISFEVRKPRIPEMVSILFFTKYRAEQVLQKLMDLLEANGQVTVEDYCAISEIKVNLGIRDLGWTNLTLAYIQPVDGLWTIRMPKPKRL